MKTKCTLSALFTGVNKVAFGGACGIHLPPVLYSSCATVEAPHSPPGGTWNRSVLSARPALRIGSGGPGPCVALEAGNSVRCESKRSDCLQRPDHQSQ